MAYGDIGATCIIGAILRAQSNYWCGLFGPPSTPEGCATSTSAMTNPWQIQDGSNTPALYQTYGSSTAVGKHAWGAVNVTTPTGVNGIYVSRLYDSTAPTARWYGAQYYNSAWTQSGTAKWIDWAASDQKRYLCIDSAIGTTYMYYMLDTYHSTEYARYDYGYGELDAARLVELPTTQELVSYRRTQTAPTQIEVKTMDGARRRYVTGVASTSIAATWRWSDDGTIAATLDLILSAAQSTADPLIVYTPAGIYHTGASMDLVVPDNSPAVTMPAPGVYELTIEGTCQP